jgi:sugar lactone lactonase YvrE
MAPSAAPSGNDEQDEQQASSIGGGDAMRICFHMLAGTAMLAVSAFATAPAPAQTAAGDPNAAPNPFKAVENWAQLPPGRKWGMVIGVDIDRDGKGVWTFDRCGSNTCEGSNLAPIQHFDADGKLLASFGAGMFVFPHGFYVDRDDNVWASDGRAAGGIGQTVIKFSPKGDVLMTLGRPGVAGNGADTFNAPSDVVVAPNGDIFVADGHGGDTNARIVKFDKNGKFIKAWGQKGSGPGELNEPHGIAMDSAGRIFVADRVNSRLQIFDQDGKFLAEWRQFWRPSGVYIDKNDMIYVADSQSDDKRNMPFRQGIRIGSAKDGKVIAFITDGDPKPNMPEGVAADADGNVYGGFTDKRTLKKFVKDGPLVR